MNLKAELLLDIQAALGDGPIWDERRGLLYWVDIQDGSLYCLDSDLSVRKVLGDIGISNAPVPTDQYAPLCEVLFVT